MTHIGGRSIEETVHDDETSLPSEFRARCRYISLRHLPNSILSIHHQEVKEYKEFETKLREIYSCQRSSRGLSEDGSVDRFCTYRSKIQFALFALD